MKLFDSVKKEWLRNEARGEEWSKEKAKSILDAVLPQVLAYDEEKDGYWLSLEWRPNFAEYCYLWDRRFCWMYQNNIYNYLCAEYTAEGYIKEVTDKRVVFREE